MKSSGDRWLGGLVTNGCVYQQTCSSEDLCFAHITKTVQVEIQVYNLQFCIVDNIIVKTTLE